MLNRPWWQRLWFTFLGRIYAFAYFTQGREILGFTISGLLKFFAWLAFIATVIFPVNRQYLPWALAVLVGIYLIYGIAARAGYMRFVARKTAVPAATSIRQIAVNDRVRLRATGYFQVRDEQHWALLRPAEYWQVPMGDHIVMVQRASGRFAYQFLSPAAIIDLQEGWLIFGKTPLPALSVTFCMSVTGDDYYGRAFYVDSMDGKERGPVQEQRTIFLTFADEGLQTAVWHNLHTSIPAHEPEGG